MIFCVQTDICFKTYLCQFLDFRFTQDAGAVIRKLKDTKTGSTEEHDKEVIKEM